MGTRAGWAGVRAERRARESEARAGAVRRAGRRVRSGEGAGLACAGACGQGAEKEERRREKGEEKMEKKEKKGKRKKKENRKWKKGSKNGKKKKGRGRRGVSALRRRLRPRSATCGVGRACAGQGRWARAALAARRRSGTCGRDDGKERERKREERFAATVATGGEEKEKESGR